MIAVNNGDLKMVTALLQKKAKTDVIDQVSEEVTDVA